MRVVSAAGEVEPCGMWGVVCVSAVWYVEEGGGDVDALVCVEDLLYSEALPIMLQPPVLGDVVPLLCVVA